MEPVRVRSYSKDAIDQTYARAFYDPLMQQLIVNGVLTPRPHPETEKRKGVAQKRLTLKFAASASGKGGYRKASIDIVYPFILCAGEMQAAYSLNRKSLIHSLTYTYLIVSRGGAREWQRE